jgi:FkbM family methyltransferase
MHVSAASRMQSLLAGLGVVAHRRKHIHYGHDALIDIGRLLPQVSVILDVGANKGQSALPFARAFPEARVYSFEPVASTFQILKQRTAKVSRIQCFDLALGADDFETTIRLAEWSGHNSLLNVAEVERGTATVRVTTGDAWADAHGVEHIDLLKIDTEGYELKVLAGFEKLLAASKVSAVLAECEFERVTPEPHTSFFELHDHLAQRGFGFVTLYTDAVMFNRFAWGNALFLRSNSG